MTVREEVEEESGRREREIADKLIWLKATKYL